MTLYCDCRESVSVFPKLPDVWVVAPMEEEEKEAPIYVVGAVVDRASRRGTFP